MKKYEITYIIVLSLVLTFIFGYMIYAVQGWVSFFAYLLHTIVAYFIVACVVYIYYRER